MTDKNSRVYYKIHHVGRIFIFDLNYIINRIQRNFYNRIRIQTKTLDPKPLIYINLIGINQLITPWLVPLIHLVGTIIDSLLGTIKTKHLNLNDIIFYAEDVEPAGNIQ